VSVVLVGYRGTGKSSVAPLVAARLGLRVLSLDRLIVEKAGKSIPNIVADCGWPGFRDLEEDLCREAARRDGVVIDCGGGVVEREANIGTLRSAGPVFWLRASVSTIVARIGHDSERPSLTGHSSLADEVAEVVERRAPLYRRLADHEIDTDGRTLESVAVEIVARMKAHLREPRPSGAE
jgi:shikimate kinase